MNELHLVLAGIPVRVCAEGFGPMDFLAAYTAAPGTPAHSFRAALVERMEPPAGEPVFAQNAFRVYREAERVLRYVGEVAQDPCKAYLRTIRRGRDGILEFRRDKLPQGITGKQLLNAIDLPHLLTLHDGILLHASYIEWEGKAILFTAPSETGKSTQARLWEEYCGAELVNGDRAAVRIIGGEAFACGIPYSGSSPVRRNVTLPLAAIVYLSQAPENAITRLRGVGAFRRVWEGCTVNTWERADVENATKTVTEVISRVPVYHLACTPDVRAVELLRRTMEVEP